MRQLTSMDKANCTECAHRLHVGVAQSTTFSARTVIADVRELEEKENVGAAKEEPVDAMPAAAAAAAAAVAAGASSRRKGCSSAAAATSAAAGGAAAARGGPIDLTDDAPTDADDFDTNMRTHKWKTHAHQFARAGSAAAAFIAAASSHGIATAASVAAAAATTPSAAAAGAASAVTARLVESLELARAQQTMAAAATEASAATAIAQRGADLMQAGARRYTGKRPRGPAWAADAVAAAGAL